MPCLKISTSQQLDRFDTEEIVFIVADGNYSDVHLVGGEPTKLTFQLKVFEEKIKELGVRNFIRVGRSLIVNKRFIQMVNVPNQLLRLWGSSMEQPVNLKVSREALRLLKEILDKEEGGQA